MRGVMLAARRSNVESLVADFQRQDAIPHCRI